MPSISAFPACCGASIITGFSGTDPAGQAGFKVTPQMTYEKDANGNNIPITYAERFKQELERYKKSYKGFMYSCILTESQIKASKGAWLPLLKENGFECVRRWTNSVHSDKEFLYLFVLCTDEKGKCGGDFTQPPKGWDELPGPEETPAKPSTFQKLKAAAVSKAA